MLFFRFILFSALCALLTRECYTWIACNNKQSYISFVFPLPLCGIVCGTLNAKVFSIKVPFFVTSLLVCVSRVLLVPFFSFKKSNFCILFVDVIELHTICDRTRDYYSSNAHTQTHISSYRSYWVLLTFVISLDIYVYTLTLFLSRWPPSHFQSVVKFEIFVFVHT